MSAAAAMLLANGCGSRTCRTADAIHSVTAHAETKQITSPYEKSLCQFIRVPSIAPSPSIRKEEFPPWDASCTHQNRAMRVPSWPRHGR
jgi:hypothetical protein